MVYQEKSRAKSALASGIMKKTEVVECAWIRGVGKSDAESLLAKKPTRTSERMDLNDACANGNEYLFHLMHDIAFNSEP